MIDEALLDEAAATLEAARAAGMILVTAESCTGGLVSGALTAVAGSSDVVEAGFVTYSNAAKVALGVAAPLIDEHGAVSEDVARALAEAARARAGEWRSEAPLLAVAVTGVAGPGGGTARKPVGLVHFAAAGPAGTDHREVRFGDIGRAEVRRESVRVALSLARAACGERTPLSRAGG